MISNIKRVPTYTQNCFNNMITTKNLVWTATTIVYSYIIIYFTWN